jgi:hypothetical protein
MGKIFELVEEEEEDDDGGGEGGGEAPFPPFPPGVLSPPPPLCIEGLEPSPCDIMFRSIMIFIISLNCMIVCLKIFFFIRNTFMIFCMSHAW